MLRIKYTDLFRATLPASSGNEGWIGISPNGEAYHVVVPVDVQIARGVMACNRPTDGTPFGGYSGWLYFPCRTYECGEGSIRDEKVLRTRRALQTAEELIAALACYEIETAIEHDPAETADTVSWGNSLSDAGENPRQTQRAGASSERFDARCDTCETSWRTLREFLSDSDVKLSGYRACVDDFPRGVYVFSHACGGKVEVSVSRFGRSRIKGKSLAGSHACPGMCYYERSTAACSAECDGALYRRLAWKLVTGDQSARIQ